MLILSRRCGESFTVGSGITVTVMAVRGKAVSLGIDAPKEVGVLRSELRRKMPIEKVGLELSTIAVDGSQPPPHGKLESKRDLH